MKTPYQGYYTALITPFQNGKVDCEAFENILNFQEQAGIHGLVVCGTTGESPTLTTKEYEELFKHAVAFKNSVKRDLPVIAGTGSNDTLRTLELTKLAQNSLADAALIVTPYYNKPPQDALYHHYKFIHDETDIPIILYNVAGRTGVELSVDTICKLAELPRIIGLKDATSDLSRVNFIRARVSKNFALFSGEDGLAAGYLAHGGDGVISVTSNIAPALCVALFEAFQNNHRAEFLKLQNMLAPLHKNLFVETSPAPVKFSASLLGLCKNELRMPLMPCSASTEKLVLETLRALGLLENSVSASTKLYA